MTFKMADALLIFSLIGILVIIATHAGIGTLYIALFMVRHELASTDDAKV